MRPRGRPSIDSAPTVGVQVRLPARQYDVLYRKAQQERVSIPEIIRRHLPKRRKEDDEQK